MTIDVSSVDTVLATTRAARRRLDLERPVDNQVVLDCIDLAEQAPTGGNISSRRWLVVRDPATKAALADVYRRSAGAVVDAAERLAGTGHPQEAVMASAAYLVEHLAEVPAIVIPSILGRYDGSGRPGLFDSVIQAAWSFCLALRARGLGSTWVTAALQDEGAVKELLGIPADTTEIVMLPVAWTIGTEFRRAPRRPAREITYFDRYGFTAEHRAEATMSFEDDIGAVAEVDIDAPATVVWELVTDIELPARFSSEFRGAEWTSDERGPGSQFVGRNFHEAIGEWTIPCYVDAREDRRAFGWCTSDPERPGARWRFELQPVGGRTRLRFTYRLGPGPSGTTMAIASHPGKEHRVLRRRVGEVLENMRRTVEGIKQLAES